MCPTHRPLFQNVGDAVSNCPLRQANVDAHIDAQNAALTLWEQSQIAPENTKNVASTRKPHSMAAPIERPHRAAPIERPDRTAQSSGPNGAARSDGPNRARPPQNGQIERTQPNAPDRAAKSNAPIKRPQPSGQIERPHTERPKSSSPIRIAHVRPRALRRNRPR